jgi:hypothetical protein
MHHADASRDTRTTRWWRGHLHRPRLITASSYLIPPRSERPWMRAPGRVPSRGRTMVNFCWARRILVRAAGPHRAARRSEARRSGGAVAWGGGGGSPCGDARTVRTRDPARSAGSPPSTSAPPSPRERCGDPRWQAADRAASDPGASQPAVGLARDPEVLVAPNGSARPPLARCGIRASGQVPRRRDAGLADRLIVRPSRSSGPVKPAGRARLDRRSEPDG